MHKIIQLRIGKFKIEMKNVILNKKIKVFKLKLKGKK